MKYYICAWINKNVVCYIECNEKPITENHLPDEPCDLRIMAEVSGPYQEAGDIFPLLSFDGQKLIGLDFDLQTSCDGVTFTTEELAAQARTDRDELLAATDWTQAADVPQATKDKWAPYRQALRDVPAQSGFPAEIVWPVRPA